MDDQQEDPSLESTRGHVLQHLHSRGGGQDATSVARSLGLKATTVRFHLEALTAMGYVSKSSEEARGRGRPRMVYRTTNHAPQADTGHLRGLLSFLLRRLAGPAPHSEAAAERMGRAWGEELAVDPADVGAGSGSAGAQSDEEPIDTLLRHTAQVGFEVTADRDVGTISFFGCPYRSLDHEALAAVCSMHLGMMRGHLAAQGSGARVLDLVPGEVCVATVARE